MEYKHICKCGAENTRFTDIHIREDKVFKCFKCKEKFTYKKEETKK